MTELIRVIEMSKVIKKITSVPIFLVVGVMFVLSCTPARQMVKETRIVGEEKVAKEKEEVKKEVELKVEEIEIPYVKKDGRDIAIFDENGNLKYAGQRSYDPKSFRDMHIFDENMNETKLLKQEYEKVDSEKLRYSFFKASKNNQWIFEFYGEIYRVSDFYPKRVNFYDRNGNLIYKDKELPEEIKKYGFNLYEVSNKKGYIILVNGHKGVIFIYNIENGRYKKINYREDENFNEYNRIKIDTVGDGEKFVIFVIKQIISNPKRKIFVLIMSDFEGNQLWRKELDLTKIRYGIGDIKFSIDGKYFSIDKGYLFDSEGNVILKERFVDNEFSEDSKYFYYGSGRANMFCYSLEERKVVYKSEIDLGIEKIYNRPFKIVNNYIVARKAFKNEKNKYEDVVIIYNQKLDYIKHYFIGEGMYLKDIIPNNYNSILLVIKNKENGNLVFKNLVL